MKHYLHLAAICVAALPLAVVPVSADVIMLNLVSVATGVDDGPQDGVFDSFTIPNLGSVNNNGYGSYRTAFEFSLSGLPAGATITSARLTMVLSNFEGTRAVEVHGYAGDGIMQLSDFALNGLVGTASVDQSGTQTLIFDVASFVVDLASTAATFAGFNVREEPANTSNFTIMQLDGLHALPVLSIEFSTGQIVDIEVDIDIEPGNVRNRINRSRRGRIPVAILSSSTFDALSEVDTASLTFGRTGDETSLAFCSSPSEDMNDDGLLDLVCHFNTQATAFLPDDTQGVLKGRTLNGIPIKGTDSVRIVFVDPPSARGLLTLSVSVTEMQDGTVSGHTLTHSYDSRGNVLVSVRETDSNYDGTPEARDTTTNTYGHGGNVLISVREFDGNVDGTVESRETITNDYDRAGNLLLSITNVENDFDADGTLDYGLIWTTASTYDARGNLLTAAVDRDDNADGVVDSRSVISNTYDVHDNLLLQISEFDYNNDGTVDDRGTTKNTYDRKGHVLIIVDDSDFGNDGTLEIHTTITNTYDSNAPPK